MGCPLSGLGTGFMAPSIPTKDPYGVLLLGEALGADEVEAGRPFVGKAGFKLTRLIEWAGLDRSRFHIANTVWCRPPDNKLEGEWYEEGAIAHCKEAHWGSLLRDIGVIVPMGNVPLGALTGRKGILSTRGYLRPGPGTTHLIPTVHPSFIQRGQSKYSAAFIHDLQKAVSLAQGGLPITKVDYVLDPLPSVARAWAEEYLYQLSREQSANPDDGVDRGGLLLAFDIETPGKAEDEGALSPDDDPTYTIERIGFSYAGGSALSIPWSPEHYGTIRVLLESTGAKVVWNGGFDCPRIRHAGFGINGTIHDGMVAWHILHSDLPKGLGFVATFTCPWQPEWKHLSGSQPAFYNATDADVELQSMHVIRGELKRVGLWEVYERDVIQLDPILKHMTTRGMPLNQQVRYESAVKLADAQADVQKRMEDVVPLTARAISPKEGYKKEPTDKTGLITITVVAPVRRCSLCGLPNPTKPHFRTLKRPTDKRPQNPCSGGCVVTSVEQCPRYASLAPFKPSRHQLIRYQEAMGRPVPLTKDKKTGKKKPTMDEKALKDLIAKYPGDTLYRSVLEYRTIDKIAGTYVGRPPSVEGEPSDDE